MKNKIFLIALLFLAISFSKLHAESDTLWTTQIGSTVRSVKFSPDGQYVYASADGRGPLKLDAKTGDIVMEYQSIKININKTLGGVDISDDGKYLYGGSDGNTIYIWDVNQINPIDSIILNYTLESSPYIKFCNVSEKHLLCNIVYKVQNSFYARMFVYDRITKKELTNFNVSNVSSTIISPDENLFVYGVTNSNKEEKGFVYIYDLEKLTLIHTFDQHTASITDLSFSPDGSLLASCDDESNVKIWDNENKEMLIGYKRNVRNTFSLALVNQNLITFGGGNFGNYNITTSNLTNTNTISTYNLTYPLDFEYYKNILAVVSDFTGVICLKADRLTSIKLNINNDKIYPNPTNNNLIIPKSYLVDNFIYLSIIDLTGKEIYRVNKSYEFNINEDLIIDVSRYLKGSYIVQIFSTTNIQTLKFIKE